MLSIQALTAGYAHEPVLHDISLHVEAGQIAGVIGPNGCGKSTLLRCAAGLLAPRAGKVLVEGDDVRSLDGRERARRVALLPQHFEGGDDLRVREMAFLGRTPHLPPYGAPSRRDWAVVDDALQAVGAVDLAERRMGQLSGGERQRVMLARALAQQPRVLLLDEPASNLDLRYQRDILSLVRHLARHENLAVLLVLHHINLAAALADTLLLLHEGRARALGAPGVVMTEEHLEAVYGVPLRVAPHPKSGRPQAQADWTFEE